MKQPLADSALRPKSVSEFSQQAINHDKSGTDRWMGKEMNKEVAENHRRLQARKELFRRFGYDTEAERDFILDSAGTFGECILEVGTGKGYTTVALARRGYVFSTFDISSEEQRYARLNLSYWGLEKQVCFILGSDGNLPFNPESFDTVLSVNTLHELARPGAILEEMSRVIAPGGMLVLSDFSVEGFELVERVHRYEGRSHPVKGVTVGEAALVLAEAGFETKIKSSRYQDVLLAWLLRAGSVSGKNDQTGRVC